MKLDHLADVKKGDELLGHGQTVENLCEGLVWNALKFVKMCKTFHGITKFGS